MADRRPRQSRSRWVDAALAACLQTVGVAGLHAAAAARSVRVDRAAHRSAEAAFERRATTGVVEAQVRRALTVYWKLNGQSRHVTVLDKSLAKTADARRRADPARLGEVGSPMPGRVVAANVREGAVVAHGDPLLTLEAMKMETVVRAPVAGKVRELCVDNGSKVQGGDLLVVIEGKA